MRPRPAELAGIALALASASAFGATTVMGKLAFREDVTVPTLLAVRFSLGALSLWALALSLGVASRPPPRRAAILVALGAVVYATQSSLFFEALARIPAVTAGLLLYSYPALVALLAVAIGRERFGWTKAGALALGLGGTTLVLGAPTGALDPTGVALALTSALLYSLYILVAERAIRGVHPLVSSALIVTGGAASLVVSGAVRGELRLGLGAPAWGWLVALGIVSVTVAVSTFLAAVERIGSSRAAIASTFEPVVTVLLAASVLDERLSGPQAAGAVLIVAAVAVLPLVERRPPAAVEAAVAPSDQGF